MTSRFLTLEGVSLSLPDGRVVFSNLNETFDARPTGLVGRNGVGKTLLAQVLAGRLAPSAGRCLRSGPVHYLAQQVMPAAGARVADLAGAAPVLAALARIEAGGCAAEDFDCIGERWDMAQRLQRALESAGLGHLDAATPAARLSGGEAMRVSLAGAMLSDADFLILDEPSNHLDARHRAALIEQLQQWPRGLLVVSHDRALLASMARTVELSAAGLRSYGGGYALYAAQQAAEREQALNELERLKRERQQGEHALRQQQERQQRRQARGERHGKHGNQAKILLDRQKERSQASAGKLQLQLERQHGELHAQVREAAQRVLPEQAIHLHLPAAAEHRRRQVAVLEGVQLPHLPAATGRVDLTLYGGQRLAVVGDNGSGKSTLLKVLAGQLQPLAGECRVVAECHYLDQHLALLDPAQTVLAQAAAAAPSLSDAELRMRLAQLGLDAERITVPSGQLSGGERLKAALAILLYGDPAPQLLLLDEPSNHLDLPSLEALEELLRSYRGALVVVSHDRYFLERLALTECLSVSAQGWQWQPWQG